MQGWNCFKETFEPYTAADYCGIVAHLGEQGAGQGSRYGSEDESVTSRRAEWSRSSTNMSLMSVNDTAQQLAQPAAGATAKRLAVVARSSSATTPRLKRKSTLSFVSLVSLDLPDVQEHADSE